MKPLRNEYWDLDPHAMLDERVRIWADMPPTRPRPGDAPYEDWMAAGHAGRRQYALHRYRAFAPILHEYEDLIDRGVPLDEPLAERFRVSFNVVKWLRYSRDDYAVHLSQRFPGDHFGILCHWLNQVYKVERPIDAEALNWFILGNRFIEWQVGLFGGDTVELAQGVRGQWRHFCLDIGTELHRTRRLEYRMLAEVVHRWREEFGVGVISELSARSVVSSPTVLRLAVTPTWRDLRETGFNLNRLKTWSYNLHPSTPVDDPSYWLSRALDSNDRPGNPYPPRFSTTPSDRAAVIVEGHYNPEPMPSHTPRDAYPVPRRGRRYR